jgi:hypothetical protein
MGARSNPFENCTEIAVPGFDGKSYRLFKRTWELKLSHQERAHVKYNFDKIVKTVKQPDEVRKSEHDHDCWIAYKHFEKYWVAPGISAPNPPGINWFAVVGNSVKRIIVTFYPTRRFKMGEKLWPKAADVI